MAVYRIYVEKKPEFAVEAAGILADIRSTLGIESVKNVRMLNRYDLEDIDGADFEMAKNTILSEPQVDVTYAELPQPAEGRVFAVEFLPGQFDQRADSCEVCIQLATGKERPTCRTARVYILEGSISDEDYAKVMRSLINPIESREASLEEAKTLKVNYELPDSVETVEGFIALDEAQLAAFIKEKGLAMDIDDIRFCQAYFRDTEKRDPTITEVKMVDTYWSDHCRHTTFGTNIDSVDIASDLVRDSYGRYLKLREKLYAGKDKPICLMDMACIGAKALKAQGMLPDLDESEEINACSVKITVDVNGSDEEWLLMFKNETHNHPTEIEPFGGAATCLGGAIRDPLSGRSYVYQAMRVTGAADPLTPFENTLAGKLPQRKIVTTAAAGYSSYGNQIGLATGLVKEIYHPNYVAKRMEIGAVVGAAPARNVVRECPAAGDKIILLGGKTGRDGCGGATGSSKSHTNESLTSCGAEVQKGNAPEERKIQRLFRNGEVTRMIKRCNDFGAGGVSVSIGELADGLVIELDAVPKKYEGLDGTELAISESQERMSVCVAPENVERFLAEADKENLQATVVATVTEEARLVMNWKGKTIVDLSREFLSSNGAVKHTTVSIPDAKVDTCHYKLTNDKAGFTALLSDLNVCSQKGLVERFDSTIGAGTVLMPYGGASQTTETQAMAAKIPVLGGDTTTCSVMAYGFNPYISEQSTYHGAVLAVIESVAKLIAVGGNRQKCWLSFQEYFERLKNDPTRWGKPMAALLGALDAQMNLCCGAIGGKDSMSGTFENIDVPPTLVSFAICASKTDQIISPEFKKAGSRLYLLAPEYKNGMPDFVSVNVVLDEMQALIHSGKVLSCWALTAGGVAEAVCKMSFGNGIGAKLTANLDEATLFNGITGGFVFEASEDIKTLASVIGETTSEPAITLSTGEVLALDELYKVWSGKLESVFPSIVPHGDEKPEVFNFKADSYAAPAIKTARPRVLIPVFPGTNCEFDTARAFEKAGAQPEILVIKNLTAAHISESVEAVKNAIANSQIIALPGGFSGGDEPDGSAKYIVSFFRNPALTEEIHKLLQQRDGLMCGICNGFQALIKLGLVPYGKIIETDDTCPTLTFNKIGRHQSGLVRTRVASNKSPWLMHTQPGDIHTIAISHGEGRFVADEKLVAQLAANGQIATQYVDEKGQPTMDIRFNPNGSVHAIEGITSPDGRVFGKMGHTERFAGDLYLNVPGEKFQPIFKGAVDYFTK
ncbi:MAG: phosphoribosylformylglycinamidine synthase [Oscillospiraceae bacterium]|nr:phosphoribosylformylglycinamidine synthase [Oscillospiraceae bacterium]